jgi:hypothetical protein
MVYISHNNNVSFNIQPPDGVLDLDAVNSLTLYKSEECKSCC